MENRKDDSKLFNPISILLYFGFWLSFILVAFCLKGLILEKITKLTIFHNKNPFFSIYEIHNSGAAFNILANQQNFIIISSIIAIIILTVIQIKYSAKISAYSSFAMGLLSAGISMNTLERINYGYVIDYFYINLIPNMPVFNIADIMIVLGAIFLICSILKK